METMSKLVELRVLVYGMKGVGVEVAKNVILAGPKSVSIVDTRPCRLQDLGSN